MNDVTLIIERIRGGDAGATDELLPIVYNELRRMAGQEVGRRGRSPHNPDDRAGPRSLSAASGDRPIVGL